MAEAITRLYDEATKALVRSIEEARLENRQNFEMLNEMIRGLMPKETTPSPGILEEGVTGSERNHPRIPQEDDQGHQTVYQETLPTKNSQTTSIESLSGRNSGTVDPPIFWGINIDSKHPKLVEEFRTEFDAEAPSQELIEDPKEHPKVITYPLELVVEVESDEIDETQEVYPSSHVNPVVTEKMGLDVGMNSVEFFEVPVAPKFVKMSSRGVDISNSPIQLGSANMVMGHRNWLFDPGGCSSRDCLRGKVINCWVELSSSVTLLVDKHNEIDGYLNFDPGIANLGSNFSSSKSLQVTYGSCSLKGPTDPRIGRVKGMILVFVPGGSFDVIEWEIGEGEPLVLCGAQFIKDHLISMSVDRGRAAAILIDPGGCLFGIYIRRGLILIFDPGGDSNGQEREEGGARVIDAEMLSDKVNCNAIKDVVYQNSRFMNKEKKLISL